MGTPIKTEWKPKFKYNRIKGLQNVFVQIEITGCSRDCMWYRDMIGDKVSAEIRKGSFYVLFSDDGKTKRGGAIELMDAKVIRK